MWQRIRESFQDPVDRPTHLNHLSIDEFLTYASAQRAFEASGTKAALIETSWANITRDPWIRGDSHSEAVLESRFNCRRLIELGVGKQAEVHRRFFADELGITEYIGVDKFSDASKHGVVKADALAFLANTESSSSNICAFGLFNEPMLIGSLSEHEYARRLAHEITRVIPAGGVLFGEGLFPGGTSNEFATYLVRTGLERDGDLIDFLNSQAGPGFAQRREVFAFRKSGVLKPNTELATLQFHFTDL